MVIVSVWRFCLKIGREENYGILQGAAVLVSNF